MDIYEIVKKLIGPINPVGETQTDDKRFDNLKDMKELIIQLISDIDEVATDNKNKYEYSMKKAGEFANRILDELNIKE